MKNTTILNIIIIVLSFALGFYFLPQMPLQIVSHWNAQGVADGWMIKFWGLFIFPIMMTFLTILLSLIPKIDPKKENIEKFKEVFEWFIVVFNLFFFYLYLLTIIWNKGVVFNMNMAIIPAFAGLFYFLGIMIGKSKSNYTIGIRLPWTLASENVWDKTHKLGGKLFKVSALIILLGLLVPDYTVWFFFVPLIITLIWLMVYSYREFKKIIKN